MEEMENPLALALQKMERKKMETDGESDELDENDKKPKKEGCVLLTPDPLPPSDALVKFFGDGESSLSRLVQRLWEYIKQNELQVCHLLSTLVYF
uniref:DM2 domain-containing protein n=1 Tax=Brassica campestris TaxID=3711 RepID=A0A3P6AAA8_BRACM|nr:unnamed protein product [Brassica rapa]